MAYTTIDDPSAHFQVKTYSGNSTQTAITFDGSSNLQPDWIWAKQRGGAHYHDWRDTSRGLTKRLVSATNDEESTKSASYVSFDSNGFTLGDDQSGGSDANTVNSNGNTYVSWCWKANGGTTSSNSDGDITATVQANTTAGFSIVTYTGNGNGSDQTVGHGLGAECKVVYQKMRTDSGQSWRFFHESISQSGGGNLFLNGSSAMDSSDPARIKSTNTSTFTLLAYTSPYNGVNASGKEYVAYCFAEQKG